MIRVTGLTKVFGQPPREVVALDNITLEVKRGDIFGVLGQSGAGKSTLIRCINLLERPSAGSILVDGQEMTSLSTAQLRRARQRIGMIFQHFNLLSSRTVADNIALPLEVVGVPVAARRQKVAALLELVGLADKAHAYPAQLSGGQKQRVGIARALANDPAVLLSDEATSALDPQTTRSILDLLRDLNQRLGITILLITHQMQVVKHICNSVAVLDQGRVVEQGAVIDLVQQPTSVLARELFPQIENPVVAPGARLVTITLVDQVAGRPLISTLVRRFEVDINILGGSIECVGTRRVGQLQLELSGPQVAAALAYARTQGVQVSEH